MNFTLEQLQAGDRAAWDHAYNDLSEYIVSVLAVGSTGVRLEDLEQIASDAVNKLAWRKAAIDGGMDGLKRWIITISRNALRDHLDKENAQKRAANKTVSFEDQPDGTEYASQSPAPDKCMDQAERALLIREAVNELPEKLRECLKAHYFDDLGYEEISKNRNEPIGSVSGQISRAKAALAPILKRMDLL